MSPIVTPGGGGGGGSQPIVTGSGSPVGVVTPDPAKPLYLRTDEVALYLATGPANTDWICVAGDTAFDNPIGVSLNGGLAAFHGGIAVIGSSQAGGGAWLQDEQAAQGTDNALYWNPNGTDGQQTLFVQTGSTGQFKTVIADAAGDMTIAHNIVIPNIPVADPHVAGALYSTAGVVHVSAG